MAVEEQLLNDSDYRCGWVDRPECGQKLTIPNRKVTKLALLVHKHGVPTGDVYLRIRKVSDDAVILEKLWGVAGDLPADGFPDWIEVEFVTPVIINEEVRLLIEGESPTNTNSIDYRYQNSDVKADENLTCGEPGDFTEPVDTDGAYKYTYEVTKPAGGSGPANLVAAGII